MKLSKQLVRKFQALHLSKCGEEISYSLAESQLKELAALVRITANREIEQNAKAIHS